jgi:hypothetical protein
MFKFVANKSFNDYFGIVLNIRIGSIPCISSGFDTVRFLYKSLNAYINPSGNIGDISVKRSQSVRIIFNNSAQFIRSSLGNDNSTRKKRDIRAYYKLLTRCASARFDQAKYVPTVFNTPTPIDNAPTI